MKNIQILVFSLISIFLFSGCTAIKLHEANQALISSYEKKITYSKSDSEDKKILYATVLASLSQLAEVTAKAADEVETSSPLNAIAFYRIATTASWQAEESNVTMYSSKGKSLCASHENEAPRDCAMIELFPKLASIDYLTRKMSNTTDQNQDERKKILNQYWEAYRELMKTRNDFRKKYVKAPSYLFDNYDSTIGDLLCQNIDNSIGKITDSKYRKKINLEVKEAKCDLDKLGFTKKQVSCMEKTLDCGQ